MFSPRCEQAAAPGDLTRPLFDILTLIESGKRGEGKVYKVVVVDICMKIRCPKCKHEWESKSKLGFLICANCGKKINVKKFKESLGSKK